MSALIKKGLKKLKLRKIKLSKPRNQLKNKTKKIPKLKLKEFSSYSQFEDYESIDQIETSPDSPVPFNFDSDESLTSRNESFNFNYKKIDDLFLNVNWEKDKRKKLFNSIIIFDWDDTLLCTSILSKYGHFSEMNKYPINDLIQISLLEAFVMELLEKSIEKGDTFIITNSEKGWVEYSCKKFFPNLFPLLSKIQVISSREKYEKMHPYNFLMWKMEVCKYFAKDYNYNINLPTNIISIGDSFADIEAGRSLENKFKKCFIKTVKFVKFPGVKDLIEQLGLILDKFEHIISSCYNWNIKVEIKIIGKKVICDLN